MSDSGDPDPRLPSTLVQLGCTWEQYARLFPEVPVEVSRIGVGNPQGELFAYLAANPLEALDIAAAINAGEIPIFGGGTEAALLSMDNVCYAVDCTRQEAPCFSPEECTESPCSFSCELLLVDECVFAPLDCVPPLPCTPDPLSCVPPLPCYPDIFVCIPPTPCSVPPTLPCLVVLAIQVILLLGETLCGEDGDCLEPCSPTLVCTAINFLTECAADPGCPGTLVCETAPQACELIEGDCPPEDIECQCADDTGVVCCLYVDCDDFQALAPPGTGPVPTSSDTLDLTIVFAHDGQEPKGRCTREATRAGVDYIISDFARIDAINIVCYDALTPINYWTPTSEPDTQTTDAGSLKDSCQRYVEGTFPAAYDDAHELILCWVHAADTNGAAAIRSNIALTADTGQWVDHPNVGIAEHELLHALGGEHYPEDSWRTYACGLYHEHWWGYHYHAYWSVMNYCWMFAGTTNIDQQTEDHIEAHIGS